MYGGSILTLARFFSGSAHSKKTISLRKHENLGFIQCDATLANDLRRSTTSMDWHECYQTYDKLYTLYIYHLH